MENSREIAENKLRIEKYEKYIEASKSKIFELEHIIAELDVDMAVSPKSFKEERLEKNEKIKQLYSELNIITEEESGDLEIKSLEINKKINQYEKELMLLEEEEEKRFLILERKREQFEEKLNKEKDNIGNLTLKIEKLSKINFELLDNPSHQIKVTLSYEENLILEELVKKQGSNKSSVIRNMIKDFSNATKERDALRLNLEKFVAEKRIELKMHENEKASQWDKFKNKLELSKKDFEIGFSKLQNENSILIENLKTKLHERSIRLEELQNQIGDTSKKIKGLIKDNELSFVTDYFEPKDFDDLPSITSSLKEEKAVIANLNKFKKEDINRFTDLIFGVIVGIGGSMKKIGHELLILSPENHKLILKKENKDKNLLDKETERYLKDLDSN